MKKFFLFMIAICVLTLSSCTQTDPSDDSKDTTQPTSNFSEITDSSNNQNGGNTQQTLFSIDTSALKEADAPLTKDSIKEIFAPLLEKAVLVHESINNDLGQFAFEEEIAFQTQQGSYSLITDEKFETVNDVWEYAYSAYTKEAAQRLFNESLDPNGVLPRFIEKDGNLYYSRSGHGHVMSFEPETVEVIEQYEGVVIVSVDCYYYDEHIKSVFIMSKTDDGWRMANSENEAINDLPQQFIN